MKKDEQIKMLLHPDKYSDEQIEQMLDESNITVPDADEAWRRFEGLKNGKVEELKKRSSLLTLHPSFRKIAAMFVGVLMLSGITYAAIRLVQRSTKEKQEQPTETVVKALPSTTNAQVVEADSTKVKPVVFENVELASVLSEVATFYHCELVYKDEKVKHVRLYFTWDKQMDIDDVVAMFNKFERFHITCENHQLIVE